MISIITMNLGGITELSSIKTAIVEIKRLQPDIILLQEVIELHEKNILTELNKELNYPYADFQEKHDFSVDYGKGQLEQTTKVEGLAILSKIQFTATKYDLPIIEQEDRWPRIAVVYLSNDVNIPSICNLHMSKLKQSRALAMQKLPKADIYAGDFNMQPGELNVYFSEQSSYEFSPYISYPSKNITLDYIIPKKGTIIECKILNNVSDHNGVFVKLEF